MLALQVLLVEVREGILDIGWDVSIPIHIANIPQHLTHRLRVVILMVLIKPKFLHKLQQDHPEGNIRVGIRLKSGQEGERYLSLTDPILKGVPHGAHHTHIVPAQITVLPADTPPQTFPLWLFVVGAVGAVGAVVYVGHYIRAMSTCVVFQGQPKILFSFAPRNDGLDDLQLCIMIGCQSHRTS